MRLLTLREYRELPDPLKDRAEELEARSRYMDVEPQLYRLKLDAGLLTKEDFDRRIQVYEGAQGWG